MTLDPLPHSSARSPSAGAPKDRPAPAPEVGQPPVWSEHARQLQFETWLSQVAERHGILPHSLRLASADASFRRYFRVDASSGTERSLIIMDAPPALEDVRPFVRVAALFEQAQVTVPRILEWQEEMGFLLLSDLGATTLMASFDLPLDAALSPLAANSLSPGAIASSNPATRWWSWVLTPQTRKSPNGGSRRSKTTGRFLIWPSAWGRSRR